jgi:hypothetical protein
MACAALHPAIRRAEPNAVVVTLRLSLPEATALTDLAYLVETLGLRVAGTVAASMSGDAVAVLHRATCTLSVGLRAARAWDAQ